jgi:hypothetical protein
MWHLYDILNPRRAGTRVLLFGVFKGWDILIANVNSGMRIITTDTDLFNHILNFSECNFTP